MQRVVAQVSSVILHGLGGLLWAALGLAVAPARAVGQDDSASVGPPPHFVAAWSPPGTIIDVSRMGVLRQRVSLDLTNTPLRDAIAEIRDQAKLNLVYEQRVVPADRTVSIQAKDITVASALAEVLLDTKLDVVMTRGGQLALVMCTHLPVEGQESGMIAGRVVDRTTGAPLSGAVVTVDGTPLAATASTTGRYRFGGLATGTHTLTAKYIGFTPMTATVSVESGLVAQDFALVPSVRQLDQVVVTGTLVPTEVKVIPTPITIITADDIRRQNVTRLTQIFRGQVAGPLAWDRPADDHYNTINVRGVTSFSTRSIKTFIDGIEMANPEFTALIDPNDIDRIELTRGPQASTLYGSDAIGGVLQIFTKKGTFGLSRPGGEIKASASLIEKNDDSGVAVRLENAVTIQGGERHTRYQAAAYYRWDDGWTPSYENTNWSVTASAENIHGPLTSRVSALFARKIYDRAWFTALRDAGYAPFSVPPFETIDLQTQTYGVNFVYAATPWWRHELVLGYDRWAFGLTQTERRFTSPTDTLLQVIMNQRGKMSIFYYNTINTKLGHAVGVALTTGFNYYRLDGSDVFSPATTGISGTLSGPTTALRLTSTNSGYFVQAQTNVAETVFLTAGLRAETSPGFGRDVGTVVSPRFGAAYVRPIGSVAVKFRASYGESIRAPGPAENQPSLAAGFERLHNPALRPERQRGSDGGVDLYWGSRASLSATYYSQDAVDLIDLVLGDVVGDPPRQQGQQQNVGRIRNHGWEFEARYSSERWLVSGAFSITRSRVQQLDADYGGDYLVGDHLFDVPYSSGGLAVIYSPSVGTSLHLNMTSAGSWVERDFVAFFGPLSGDLPPRPSGRDYWITYPGFTKFRVGVEQQLWKGVTGMFGVENITNERAFETNNIDIPSPRMFTFTLRASY